MASNASDFGDSCCSCFIRLIFNLLLASAFVTREETVPPEDVERTLDDASDLASSNGEGDDERTCTNSDIRLAMVVSLSNEENTNGALIA